MEKLKVVIADFDEETRQQIANFVHSMARRGRVKVELFYIKMAVPTPSVIGIYGASSKYRRRLSNMVYTALTKAGRQQCKLTARASDTLASALADSTPGLNFVLHVDDTVPAHFKLASANPNSGAVSGIDLSPGNPHLVKRAQARGEEEALRYIWQMPAAWFAFAAFVAAVIGLVAALN